MSDGSNTGIEDARQSSEIQTRLFQQYGQAGLPGLKGALSYTRGALGQGLPQYVQDAYRGASVGATENNVRNLTSLQSKLYSRGGSQKQGGSLLSGLSNVAGTAGDAYTREMAGIRTSQAVAGVEQRNKLLGILAGGAASGTNLAAGFGTLGNNAQQVGFGSDPTNGYIMGGLSAGLGLYASLNQGQPNTNLGYDKYFQGAGYSPDASAGLATNFTRPLL